MPTQYQLVMRNGPTPGATYSLDADLMTIGRDPNSTISVNDPEVSRYHAKMMRQGGKIVIEDNGSTNGTSINGRRISGPHVLRAGEMISLGEDIAFSFESLNYDPDATIVSSGPAAAPRQRPVVPPPPPPQRAYAGRVPADPAPIPPPASQSKSGGRKAVPVAIGLGALAVICSCGGFLFWVDAANKWCDFFPFLFGSACG